MELELEEKDVIDMIVEGKTSLDDALSEIVERPSFEINTRSRAIESRIEDLKQKYFGQEEIVEVKETGLIPRLCRSVKYKLIGGTRQETAALIGAQQEGLALVTEVRDEIDSVKQQFTFLYQAKSEKEEYLQQLENSLNEHSAIYLRMNDRSRDIQAKTQKLDERLKTGELGTEALCNLRQLREKLVERYEKIAIRMGCVGARIEDCNTQIKYLREETLIDDRNISATEMALYKLEGMLEGVELRMRTEESTMRMSEIGNRINSLQALIKDYQDKMHEMVSDRAKIATQIALSTPLVTSYDKDQVRQITEARRGLERAEKESTKNLHDRVMSIIYLRNEGH